MKDVGNSNTHSLAFFSDLQNGPLLSASKLAKHNIDVGLSRVFTHVLASDRPYNH